MPQTEITALRGDLLGELRDLLSTHPGKDSLLVSNHTIHNLLTGFRAGRISASEIRDWAIQVELHNDEIVYETGYTQTIADVVFRLSTPEINGPLDKSSCDEMWSGFLFKNVIEPCGPSPAHRCPCCGFRTLCGRGQFETCPVCYWEDDGQDEHDTDIARGGPNGYLSLREARVSFAKYGACEQRFVPKVRAPLPEEL